jgi:hypothetical protein
MAKTIFDPRMRQSLSERLAKLRPDSRAQFGKFTADRMICHLEDSLRVATGVTPARPKQTMMSNPLVRWLVIYVLPWPKGKAQTVKELLTTQPGEFEADRKRLDAILADAAQRGPSAHWATHPAFGNVSGRDYGVLIYRHFDHHFRQFGV